MRASITPIRALYAARLLEGAAFSSLMPFVLLHFTRTLGLTPVSSGAILSVREIMPVFTGVAAGWLVGRSGCRSLLGGSLLLLALATFAWMAGVGGTPALWVAAAISGMATSAVRVGFSSSVADLTTKEASSQVFAMLHSSANVGFAMGPLLNAYWVQREDYSRAFLVPIVLYLIAAGLVVAGIGGDVGRTERAPEQGDSATAALRQYGAFGLAFIIAVMIVIFFNGIRLQANLIGLGKYFVDYFHSTRATSLYWTAESLAVVALVPFGGRWMTGWALRSLFTAFVAGMALIAAAFCSLGYFGPAALGPAFTVLVVLSVIGECLCVPAYGALLVNLFGSRKAGLAFGLSSTVAAIGMSTGASLGGALLERSLRLGLLPSYWRWVGGLCVAAYFISFAIGYLALSGYQRKHVFQQAAAS